MNHWLFIIAAYALVTIGVGSLTLLSYRAMRKAERDAQGFNQL
ncbi:hypothetical protein [Allosphingosinicella vermicomposti]|nr:hypothetical protein [Allosphingosinicella vermicomposti]